MADVTVIEIISRLHSTKPISQNPWRTQPILNCKPSKYFVFIEVASALIEIIGGNVFYADYSLCSTQRFIRKLHDFEDHNRDPINLLHTFEYSSDPDEKTRHLENGPAIETNRRAIAIHFATRKADSLFAVLCFNVKDLNLKNDKEYKDCVILTEMYLSDHRENTNKLATKIIECLAIASVSTNAYLTFFMGDKSHKASHLGDIMTDIKDRITPEVIPNIKDRSIYMVRLSRMFLGLVFDRIYLNEFLAAFGIPDRSANSNIILADKLLMLGCCHTRIHQINRDTRRNKQFMFMASLVNVFAEDPV
jgi:hypothetical protein